MNIETVKAIPIVKILEKRELKPVSETEANATYYSMFKEQETPNFHVDKNANTWADHDLNISGNAYDLVARILAEQGFNSRDMDVFRWIRVTNLDPAYPAMRDRVKNKKSKWKLLDKEKLKNVALRHYLGRRGINVRLAKKYLNQVYVRKKCSLNKLWAIGFKNEDGGFEFENSFIKGCVAPRTITFIFAHIEKPPGIMIFKDFMDFLSYLTAKKGHLQHDVIILHSVACVDHAIRYIKGFGYKFAFTWMPNTPTGKAARARLATFFEAEPGLVHKPKNELYADHLTVNEWHMHLLNLKPIKTTVKI